MSTKPDKGLIFPSHQRSNYQPCVFPTFLAERGVTQLFSDSGSPHDNSLVESFSSSSKSEDDTDTSTAWRKRLVKAWCDVYSFAVLSALTDLPTTRLRIRRSGNTGQLWKMVEHKDWTQWGKSNRFQILELNFCEIRNRHLHYANAQTLKHVGMKEKQKGEDLHIQTSVVQI